MNEYITTYTGIHIVPSNPSPEEICIDDIAHALSIDLSYEVQPFIDVEEEYLDLFYRYSGVEKP